MALTQYVKSIYHQKFPALTHKDFRNYWLGQAVSLLGSSMQTIGLTWLVFSITKSPFLLGLLETVRLIPFTLFSLFAGVVIDKYPKRNILLIEQTTSMVVAFILSALAFTNHVRYAYVLILAVISGLALTIGMPARRSFTIEMTGKEDLVNAIALSSVTGNLTRIVGPAVGALVLAYFGAGWCFLLNGLSFLGVIASLLRMEPRQHEQLKAGSGSLLGEIKDGLKYVAADRMLLQTIFLTVVMGIFAYNYDILIPVFAKNILHQGEKVYGLLLSSLGIGSFLGALMVSLKGKSNPTMKGIIAAALIESAFLVLISFTRVPYLTIIFLAGCGIFNIWFDTAANSMLQLNAKDEYRGRITSVYTLVYAGTGPVGFMLAGAAADRFGASMAFFLSGAASILLIVLLNLSLSIIGKRKSQRDAILEGNPR